MFPKEPTENRVKLNQVIERGILSYLIAQSYDKKPIQRAREQKLVFTPLLPSQAWSADDPAAFSNVLLIEYEDEDPQPQNGQLLNSDNKKGDYNCSMDMLSMAKTS